MALELRLVSFWNSCYNSAAPLSEGSRTLSLKLWNADENSVDCAQNHVSYLIEINMKVVCRTGNMEGC